MKRMWQVPTMLFVLAACSPADAVQVPVTVVVRETQPVVQTQIVSQTQIVNQTEVVEVPAGAFTEPHPILSDLRVRQAMRAKLATKRRRSQLTCPR